LSTVDDFINSSGIIFLVTFLAMRETVASLKNYLILLERSIWFFRHLEHQNMSIISDSIGRAQMVLQFWWRRSWIR